MVLAVLGKRLLERCRDAVEQSASACECWRSFVAKRYQAYTLGAAPRASRSASCSAINRAVRLHAGEHVQALDETRADEGAGNPSGQSSDGASSSGSRPSSASMRGVLDVRTDGPAELAPGNHD
jgi:hypothetical protein